MFGRVAIEFWLKNIGIYKIIRLLMDNLKDPTINKFIKFYLLSDVIIDFSLCNWYKSHCIINNIDNTSQLNRDKFIGISAIK